MTVVLRSQDFQECQKRFRGATHTQALPMKIMQTLASLGLAHKNGVVGNWFKPDPTEVVLGGLQSVQTELQKLHDGKASAGK